MSPNGASSASITGFRGLIRSLLEREAGAERSRDVVVLAVDGIPYELALASWPRATTTRLRSVFPTTSSTGWLSSLTGADVDSHGVPGVVFRLPDRDGELVEVFSYKGPLDAPSLGNVFEDAAALGYVPISVLGDWEPYDCAWRDELLRGSRRLEGFRFYTSPSPLGPEALRTTLSEAIGSALAVPASAPRLVWCFVDADQRVHRRGYDDELVRFLELVDEVAAELVARGAVVVAHSDHGLRPTRHDEEVARVLAEVEERYACPFGGAGRTRWAYARPGTEDRVVAALEAGLPSSVRIRPADELFRPGSLARARVGDVVLVAEGEEFVTSSGYVFDHGSLGEAELHVPFAEWAA